MITLLILFLIIFIMTYIKIKNKSHNKEFDLDNASGVEAIIFIFLSLIILSIVITFSIDNLP